MKNLNLPLNMGYNLWIAFFLIALLPHCSFADNDENATIIDEVTPVIQNGITSFTIKLNQLLQENSNTKNTNILFSPINLYAALALVHLGTDGTTRDEIATLMGIPKILEAQKVHESIKTLLTSTQDEKIREGRSYHNGHVEKVILTNISFADGIFVQNGLSLNKKYIADTKSYYDSEVINVDFVNKGNEATDIINQYVANKTENRIPQLYTEPQSSDTRIILASSLYFKSVWDTHFKVEDTKPDVFYVENGNITVDMMHKNTEMPYVDIPSLGLEATKIWFADKAISLIVALPYENQTLNNLQKNLTVEDINKIIEELGSTKANRQVDLKLPKTSFKWSKSINQELKHLGIKKLFDEGAELKNMVDEPNLKVTEVGHATDIKITEDGTEASAVTTVKIGLRSSAPRRKAVFHVNRPFLTIIYHHTIKSILFFGTVHNPNG